MSDELERLVETLLWEGYALYPYTPGATKNATPTPFGIVYPPVYAADSGATHDIARLECVAEAGPDAAVSASVRFLEARAPTTGPGAAPRSRRPRRGRAVRLRTACEGRVRLAPSPPATDACGWRCACTTPRTSRPGSPAPRRCARACCPPT